MRSLVRVFVLSALLALAACVTTGGGGGGSSEPNGGGTGQNAELTTCPSPIATVALASQQEGGELSGVGLPSSALPAMRLVAHQSNCSTIVNRDVALKTIQAERALMQANQPSGNFGAGRIMPADYTLMVEVMVSKEKGGSGNAASSIFGALAGLIPYAGAIASPVASGVASGVRIQESRVLLTLIDNRSTVQVSTVTGKASGTSFTMFGNGFDAGGYESSELGKAVVSAMVDATNQLIPQVRKLGKSLL